VSLFNNVSGYGGTIEIKADADILLGDGNSRPDSVAAPVNSGAKSVAVSAVGVAAVVDVSGGAAGSNSLKLRSVGGFEVDQQVDLVDGEFSERFTVTNVDPTSRTITLSSPLSRNYSSTTQVLVRREATTVDEGAALGSTELRSSGEFNFHAGQQIEIETANGIQAAQIKEVKIDGRTLAFEQPLSVSIPAGARIYAATPQTISMLADRNLLAGPGTLVTTDDLRGGSYKDFRADSIRMKADANNNAARLDLNNNGVVNEADYLGTSGIQDGIFMLGLDSRLRTDGGVAARFVNRPVIAADPALVSVASVRSPNAFFRDFFDPGVSELLSAGADLIYTVSFSLTFPTVGEESLRVDIDWRDPKVDRENNPGNDSKRSRIESTYFSYSDGSTPERLLHGYSLFDFLEFLKARKNPIILDFAVSHHETIELTAGLGIQGGVFSNSNEFALPYVAETGLAVDGNLSTTDNLSTGGMDDLLTRGKGPFIVEPTNTDRSIAVVSSDELSNQDYHFEGGTIRLNLPSMPFQPQSTSTPFVTQEIEPLLPQETLSAPQVTVERELLESVPLDPPVSASQDFYVLRIRLDDGKYQAVDDSDGPMTRDERLLNPQWLQKYIRETDLPANSYELWLITRKKSVTGEDIVIERQLLQFEVRSGSAALPSRDDQESLVPGDLRLAPAAPPEVPAAQPVEEPAGAALELPADPAAAVAAAGQMRASVEDEPDESGTGELPFAASSTTAAIAGLIVTRALKTPASASRTRLCAAALSVSRKLREKRNS
jgi:hypothetical protein